MVLSETRHWCRLHFYWPWGRAILFHVKGYSWDASSCFHFSCRLFYEQTKISCFHIWGVVIGVKVINLGIQTCENPLDHFTLPTFGWCCTECSVMDGLLWCYSGVYPQVDAKSQIEGCLVFLFPLSLSPSLLLLSSFPGTLMHFQCFYSLRSPRERTTCSSSLHSVWARRSMQR